MAISNAPVGTEKIVRGGRAQLQCVITEVIQSYFYVNQRGKFYIGPLRTKANVAFFSGRDGKIK